MKFPGFVVEGTWLFPPAAGYHHVKPAVLVDVAHSQAMRKALGSGNLISRYFFVIYQSVMGRFVC